MSKKTIVIIISVIAFLIICCFVIVGGLAWMGSNELNKINEKMNTVTPQSNEQAEQQIDPNYTLYTNEANRFTIAYNNEWEAEENLEPTIVAFMSPMQSDVDTFRENINIVSETLPSEYTAEEYKQAALESLMQGINNYQTVEVEPAGPADSATISYTGSLAGQNLQWLQVVYIRGNEAFIVTYSGSVDGGYEEYIDEARQTIASFKFN